MKDLQRKTKYHSEKGDGMNKETHEVMYEFIKDFWSFLKAYWEIIDTDEWWDSFFDNGNRLADKYAAADQAVFQTVKKQVATFMLTQQDRWKAVKKAG